MSEALVSQEWNDDLLAELRELRRWLSDPIQIDTTVEELADLLVEKHHDYGEDNLNTFGEFGVLVRASDKIARLKNLLDKPGEVPGERREDTWRDLAGYAVQALIMLKRAKSSANEIFDIRKDRLLYGLCPDCGAGVVMREMELEGMVKTLRCSERCGFVYRCHFFDEGSPADLVLCVAREKAVREQKL